MLLCAGLLAAWCVVGLALRTPLADGLPRLRESWWDGAVILAAFTLAAPALRGLRAEKLASFVEPARPAVLGAMRAWIAAILLAQVLWEDLPSSAYLPRGMLDLRHHWLVALLHGLPIGFDRFLASHTALQAYEAVTIALLLLAMAGLRARWTVPAAALAYLLYAHILRSYAWSYHMGLIPLHALLVLSLTPCGDGWSLDRVLRARRGLPVAPPEPRLRYGMGRFLVWMAIAIPYTMAGFSKLRKGGALWWRGEHMKQMIVSTVVEPMQFGFRTAFVALHWPGWIWDALGLMAIVGELTFVLVLVSRLARRLLPLIMVGMHVGILFMQNILFPDLIAIQAVFYDWAPLRRRLAARWTALTHRQSPHLATSPAMATAPPPSDAPAAASVIADARDRLFRRQALAAQVLLAAAFVVWTARMEKFPLSAMQMFSTRLELEPVEFVRPFAVYADGRREPARFERWIPAMSDSRYRRLIRDWERPERLAVLHEFLDRSAARANAAAPPGRRIRRFELERRRWDFRRHPDEPDGTLLAVLCHDVRP
ncbi:MAG TPA: hypothetical protein VJT67_15385 [Longimicrobiaceae bacterium]|nr:hypothetical protein [Longimicrobiaceae bacterium]